MIIPTTYAAALALTLLSMLCWGSWANTFKLTKKWRFELFYFDYAIGVFVAALIAAFTFGTLGNDGLTFADNFEISPKRLMFVAFVAGGVFNLANMLLVAAISLTGLAVAFPVGIGLALVIGVVLNHLLAPAGNAALLFGGAALVVLAIVFDALAYRAQAETTGTAARFSPKGLVISLISGVLMGLFYPMVQYSRGGEIGLGPYTVAVVFALGVLLSTFVFNLYFMNLPVQGKPISPAAYLKGTKGDHALGLLGGMIWCAGAVANFAASSAPQEAHVGPAVSYALGQGATMISALWGVLVWKEFAGAGPRAKLYLAVMFLLFLGGLGMISVAPLYVAAAGAK